VRTPAPSSAALSPPNPESPAPQFQPICLPSLARVFILYEDTDAGQRAMHTVRHLTAQTGGSVEFKSQLWRFDLLQYPHWWKTSLHDASHSDILIVSTRKTDLFPTEVSNWIKAYLANRKEQDLAMISLFGADNGWGLSLKDAARFFTARQITGTAFALTSCCDPALSA